MSRLIEYTDDINIVLRNSREEWLDLQRTVAHAVRCDCDDFRYCRCYDDDNSEKGMSLKLNDVKQISQWFEERKLSFLLIDDVCCENETTIQQFGLFLKRHAHNIQHISIRNMSNNAIELIRCVSNNLPDLVSLQLELEKTDSNTNNSLSHQSFVRAFTQIQCLSFKCMSFCPYLFQLMTVAIENCLKLKELKVEDRYRSRSHDSLWYEQQQKFNIALQQNKQLKMLNLNCYEKSASMVIDCIKYNRCLTVFHASNSDFFKKKNLKCCVDFVERFNNDELQQITQALEDNFVIQELFVSRNGSLPKNFQMYLQRNRNACWKNCHSILLDVCIAMMPLELPAYILLEIVNFLPFFFIHRQKLKIDLILKVEKFYKQQKIKL